MARLERLRSELDAGHPVTGAYDPDHEIASGQINAPNRQRNRQLMTASEILQAINAAEFSSLTNNQEQQFWRLMAIGNLNPFGIEATIMVNIFGAGSTTITTLNGLRRETISRARELNLGTVRAGTVAAARAL